MPKNIIGRRMIRGVTPLLMSQSTAEPDKKNNDENGNYMPIVSTKKYIKRDYVKSY